MRRRRSRSRRPRHTRVRHYSRENDLTTGEMVAGGVALILLIGGVAWYMSSKNAANTSTAALSQGATAAQLGIPGWMTPQQGAAYASGQIDANGNPIGG